MATKDPIDHLTLKQARLALKNIREVLYPGGDADAEWDSDTADNVARVFTIAGITLNPKAEPVTPEDLIRNEADRLYDNEKIREPLFEEAYEIFPGYNDEEAEDAADWIYDRMLEKAAPKFRENAVFMTHLYENIYAGLT